MAAPALSLILVVVLVVSFWPEVRQCLCGLERLVRRAEEWLSDLWALVVTLGTVAVALPAEVMERFRRR